MPRGFHFHPSTIVDTVLTIYYRQQTTDFVEQEIAIFTSFYFLLLKRECICTVYAPMYTHSIDHELKIGHHMLR